MRSKARVNKLKRFPHLVESLSESQEVILESDEEEERLTHDSPMKENCSNNIRAILPTGSFVVAEIYCTSQNLKNLLIKLLMALMKKMTTQ